MAMHWQQSHRTGSCRGAPHTAKRIVAVTASKPHKGFGKVQKPAQDEQSSAQGSKADGGSDKQTFRHAAAAATGTRSRPVNAEEASRGKLDYVQVADWGDGDRSKLGELRLLRHVPQYAGGGAAAAEAVTVAGGTAAAGGVSAGVADADAVSTAADTAATAPAPAATAAAPEERPFHVQLAQQLQMAESRGALAVAGPAPPPPGQWSFREGRYTQYLADLREVHAALEAALLAATSDLPDAAAPSPPSSSSSPTSPPAPAAASTATAVPPAAVPTAAAGPTATAAPLQCARSALLPLRPGRLGLERSGALAGDLAALAGSAEAWRQGGQGQQGGVRAETQAETQGGIQGETQGEVQGEVQGQGQGGQGLQHEEERRQQQQEQGDGEQQQGQRGKGKGRGSAGQGGRRSGNEKSSCTAGPMARSYGQVLRRLGREAAAGESEQERQTAALRLLAHASVLHLVGQAAGVRLGATAAEKLGLLQRGAAATYHCYPQEVGDPRVTLYRALDAAGSHVRSPVWRQVVFEEVAGAMQKAGLLMTALAHRD